MDPLSVLMIVSHLLLAAFAQEEECVQNLLNVSSVPVPDTAQLRYFPLLNDQMQHYIVPQYQFTCHGVITSYTALTVVQNTPSFITSLPHLIDFTIWRPGSSGIYKLVGTNTLSFGVLKLGGNTVPVDNSTGLLQENLAYFEFSDEQPAEKIRFRPGDVLGYSIHQVFGNMKPMSLVYREGDEDEMGYNAFSVESTGQTLSCAVSECDPMARTLTSIVPYLTVKYNMTAPTEPEDLCEEPTSEDLVLCTAASTTSTSDSPPTATTSGTVECEGDNCALPIITIAAISCTIFVLLFLIVLMVVILLCCLMKRRRGTYLLKSNMKTEYQLEDNPTYASADEVHTKHDHSKDDLHFETQDGAIYTLPSTKKHDPEMRNTTNLEELFDDGSCYASTYQTNGEIHIYQELPEVAKQVQQRGRASSMAVSQEVIKTKPSLPLRMTASSASVSRFPYTMPNTPALLGGADFTKQSFQGFPYMESRPSLVSDQKMSGTSFPYIESRPSLASSSYLDSKPSTSYFPSTTTPEETPPSSATLESPSTGLTMRKLFHAVDDEILSVPSASQRQEFKTLDNPDEIYSKLKHAYSKQSRDSVDAVFLDQTDPYWIPSSTTSELYDELAKRKFREIQRKQVRVTDSIGSGNFGRVYKGLWQIPGGVMEVAVKTLNPEAPDSSETKFLREAAIMGQFLHPNVVKLLGVVTVGEPLMIVLELMPKGDLKQYLRSLDYMSAHVKEDLPTLLLNFCRQIGFGMNYLANKAFVHRDLAARNILLTNDLTCKIGDFGMSRDLEDETVYFSQGGQMPLRWTAPEALKYHQFSSASDVWSYGMLLFEIWSLGKRPFEGILTKRLMTLVNSGFYQAPPPGCPRAIYKLMVDCWPTQAEKRISFSEICTYLNSQSEENLLAWNNEDSMVSSRCRELGASLSEAKKLYMDLQYSFSDSCV